MAVVVQDTNLIETNLVFDSGDTVFVTEGTIIADDDSSSVDEISILDLTFFNAGTIVGSGDNILISTGPAAPTVDTFWSIQNQITGTIHGESTGMILDGTTTTGIEEVVSVINHGTISADQYGAIVTVDLDVVSLINTGTLFTSALGGGYPVEGAVGIRYATQGSVTNSGSIISNSTHPAAKNSAALSIRDSETGSDFEVTNSGLIQGVTYSFYADSDNLSLNNSGDMIGEVYVVAFDDVFVTNSGTIVGDTTLLGISAKLVNSGEIIGDVLLSAFGATYRAVGDGSVTGTVNSGDGNDLLIGGSNADVFLGSDGADELFGRDGDDDLDGGTGDDFISAGRDDDIVIGGDGNDVMFGGSGDDILEGNKDNDIMRGGHGHDELIGGAGNDVLRGEEGNDILDGSSGSDDLFGGYGDDELSGGGGSDDLNGGRGDDELTGGGGGDAFIFTRHNGNDVVTDFEVGVDTLDFSAFDVDTLGEVKAAGVNTNDGWLMDLSLVGGTGTILLVGILEGDLLGSDMIF